MTRYVRSVEQVEILCLFTADPLKVYTVPEIQKILQSSEKSIAACLEHFSLNRLLTEESAGSYRLAPKTNELAGLASRLVATYRERRVAVIQAIYGRPSDALQDFADAFKLRKEK